MVRRGFAARLVLNESVIKLVLRVWNEILNTEIICHAIWTEKICKRNGTSVERICNGITYVVVVLRTYVTQFTIYVLT